MRGWNRKIQTEASVDGKSLGRVLLWKGRARHLVLLVSPSPYSPEVIKKSLLELGKQQGDGRLSVHRDDPLASSKGSVTHKLILISKSLHTL